MSQLNWQTERVLIWGKTYPELSTKYFETVCTAGVTERGRPVRLYPIPYRYLDTQFKKYQWIEAAIAKNPSDSRPESYRINCDSIQCGDVIPPTPDEWGKRAEVVFREPSWQFESVEELHKAQRGHGTSLGVVVPREIDTVKIVPRPIEDAKSFEEKLAALRIKLKAQSDQFKLFEESVPEEMKKLDFVKARPRVKWRCHSQSCAGHDMQVLDWEVAELQRKVGDDAAIAKMKELCNLSSYALKFFLGNLYLHPTSFMIGSLWYPKRASDRLFL
jgi:hypothetical protein